MWERCPLEVCLGTHSPGVQHGTRTESDSWGSWLMGRGWAGAWGVEEKGGDSCSEGNVLITGVNTIQTERNCLNPRTGSKESHYLDL